MKLFKIFFFVFILIPAFSGQILAQVIFKSIETPNRNHNSLRINASERDSTQIEIPFWDDFSRSTFLPDSALWFLDDGTASISQSLGINPPTVNVAVFDGWNSKGTPYSTLVEEIGPADSLVSRFIDLSSINPQVWPTLYISFFWQKRGQGEIPDSEDSIRLQVMTSENVWKTVWSKTGENLEETNTFFFEIIQLPDPLFFHDYFQFRFQAYGRRSGGYDSWNIDYIYLNINRTPSDNSFEDRALVTTPSSWLTAFSAMPYDHFILGLEQNLQPTSVLVNNLDKQVQPIEYYAQIRDTTKIYDEMNLGTPVNLAPKTISKLTSEPVNPDAFDAAADTISLALETKFFINSGDSTNWLGKFDYRTNDTTRSVVLLDNVLAYDDGSAEWAAGLSQSSAMVAYRFILPEPDVITAVKFYFPEFAPTSVGKTFNLIIWEDIYKGREGRLLTEQHIVQRSPDINAFVTYNLGRPVAAVDTIYVGYEQTVSDFFPLGLDKDGLSHPGNIFINLDGVWELGDQIEGNLMIRPVFGFKKAVGLEDEVFRGIKVYPNPNNGNFTISGEFDKAWVMNALGIQIGEFSPRGKDTDLELQNTAPGIYLLKVLRQGKYKTFKFVIE
jgi:hypothetical protein